MVWYEGSGTGDKRWLAADERGSIVSVSNASGAALAVNTYDEYGIPGPNNLGRFQYTGQSWIAGLGMYDYKARMYSPTLGRFMQTDPIGYGDGPNWYNYVGSDPVNFVDPTGLKCKPPSGPAAAPDEIVVVAKCDDGEGGGGPKEFPKPTSPQVPGFGSTDASDPPEEPDCQSSSLAPLPSQFSTPVADSKGIERLRRLGVEGQPLGLAPYGTQGKTVLSTFPGSNSQAYAYFSFLTNAAGDWFKMSSPFSVGIMSVPSRITYRVSPETGGVRIDVPAKTFSLNRPESLHVRQICPAVP